MGKEGDTGSSRFIRWFTDLTKEDIGIAGGKGAQLAEAYNVQFPTPPGFVISTAAYDHFIRENGLQKHIVTLLRETNMNDHNALAQAAEKIRHLLQHARMPEDLQHAIIDAYDVLDVDKQKFSAASEGALDILRSSHEPPFVAVRSSATQEDSAQASFAGQHESILNVKGNDALLASVKRVFSSLFTARAIAYRERQKQQHEHAKTAIIIQRMIDADKSGVMFSKHYAPDDESTLIEAIWGLGEGIVSGKIDPDHYVIDKNLEVREQTIAEKRVAVTRSAAGKTEIVQLRPDRSTQAVLSAHELKLLTQYAQRLEDHFGTPQDIEFAISERDISILQTRPITNKQTDKEEKQVDGNVLVSGRGASPGVISGIVRIIHDKDDLEKIQEGNILVVNTTDPILSVALHKAAALITDSGGTTSHSLTVTRELGIPAIVNTKNATEKLSDGQLVTVDGRTGRVIEGEGVERVATVEPIVPTRTAISLVIDSPNYAKSAASSGAVSAGLVRTASIAGQTGKHPAWFITHESLDEYTALLYEGLRKTAQPFNEVWVRTYDIRSDEYRNLDGLPETLESNPLLGNHGIRFSLQNQDFLVAELQAVKDLADEYSDKTIGILLPNVISVTELQAAKKIMGDISMPENIKLGVMIQTPAAVQIINDLCEEGVDLVYIDAADLTQHTLAVDRTNESLNTLYDELNPAILNSIKYTIRRCKRYNVLAALQTGLVDNKDMLSFLVEHGVDRLVVTPQKAREVSELVASCEGTATPQQTVPNTTSKATPLNEEELILQALEEHAEQNKVETPVAEPPEDDYRPSIPERDKDIPSLNEAIPINSGVFEETPKEDPTVEIAPPSEEKQNSDQNVEEKQVFEEQQEELFNKEISEEAHEYEQSQAAAAAAKQQEQEQKQDLTENTALDIF